MSGRLQKSSAQFEVASAPFSAIRGERYPASTKASTR
jgi:hypothetical protein